MIMTCWNLMNQESALIETFVGRCLNIIYKGDCLKKKTSK